MIKKTETIAEFLARGGKITVIPPRMPESKESNVKPTTTGPANIITYAEADQFYGQKTVRKKKEKKIDLSKIDMNNVPEDLKKILGLE